MIPKDYLRRVYAGWLGKVIGIRLGAPIEGWTYEKIRDNYGEVSDYLVDYSDFAADDDSNGPLFFLRALGDLEPGSELTAQDIGNALLNYAPYEHGFFWWGGYGVSTEHTAYLNLRSGIKAPRSGSAGQNGAAVAEQIGGQIFIDTWGLVAPGNPDLAAKYAERAASATHGGNGVYGGIFVAVCISMAFIESDARLIIDKALSYIPANCEYARAVRAVAGYHAENPADWCGCYKYIYENFGYDRYPGNCHIIPNIAVMILALLYGENDFSKTITICAMCGWDTDCNAGNIGAIMGVLCGIEGIEDHWIAPVHDLLICSGVMGSLNIMDIPFGASYIAMLAYRSAGEEIPGAMRKIVADRIDSCHFEYPKSTHSMAARVESSSGNALAPDIILTNSDEEAFTGERSLKMTVKSAVMPERVRLYKKTHYEPTDFYDSRYDPSFSPLIYPGQTVHGSAFIPAGGGAAYARLYAGEQRTGEEIYGERALLEPGKWHEMTLTIPPTEGALLCEAGFLFEPTGEQARDFTAFIDDLYFGGMADYSVDFRNETHEVWHSRHIEISQFTRVKGIAYLEGGQLELSCADFAEMYTGRHDWKDYSAVFTLTPVLGEKHCVNFRVQGAIRSYAFGFNGRGRLALLKNENGYRALTGRAYDWEYGKEYTLSINVKGSRIEARCGSVKLVYADPDRPYLYGAVGVSVRDGSHCRYRSIRVK